MTTLKTRELVRWLSECATYFEGRDHGREDLSFISNSHNSRNAKHAALLLYVFGKMEEGLALYERVKKHVSEAEKGK
jgi:hypothetical protein